MISLLAGYFLIDFMGIICYKILKLVSDGIFPPFFPDDFNVFSKKCRDML